MRRRLTITIVGLVAGALVMAGLGTWALERRGAAEETRQALVDQAEALAQVAEGVARPALLTSLNRSLRLDGSAVVRLARDGTPVELLPAGLRLEPSDGARLAQGEVVSGRQGDRAFAVAPFVRRNGQAAIVLSRRQASGAKSAAPFFVFAALLSLGAAGVVAARLARRMTHPLAAASAAAGRIAEGDLSARIAVSPTADAELADLTNSVNAMAAALERSKGLERQFLMSVSHDLRTPLTSVRGFAEAIADGTATDTARAAQVIGAEARRLERLVADLLELAKLDARSFSLALREVDVAEVVADTVEGFGPAAAAAGVTLVLSPSDPTTGLVATADPERLAQVVANLVENALKYAGARIEVTVERAADSVTVIVTDDGPGIATADAPHMFERLFQSSRTPARPVGSGLGLAIVAELVTAMAGQVEATSQPGSTCLVVALPAA